MNQDNFSQDVFRVNNFWYTVNNFCTLLAHMVYRYSMNTNTTKPTASTKYHESLNCKFKVPIYDMKFHLKGLWLHCKDHLKWLNNFFYRILVTCSLCKIFNFICFICKYHRCDITSDNEFSEKYSFLDEYVSKKLKNCPCICINFITGS
jgi:hypothetical protein